MHYPINHEALERVETPQGRTYAHHIKRYEFAAGLIKNMSVCSLACGTGYGEYYMATHGAPQKIVGIDISAAAIAHAHAHYSHPLVNFVQSDKLAASLPDASVDIFVSFETIEHIDNDNALILEARRVLKTGGILIISTPNRGRTWKNLCAERPFNPYHVREYTTGDLKKLLGKYFSDISFYGQRRILRRTLVNMPVVALLRACRILPRIERDDFAVVAYPQNRIFDFTYITVICTKH